MNSEQKQQIEYDSVFQPIQSPAWIVQKWYWLQQEHDMSNYQWHQSVLNTILFCPVSFDVFYFLVTVRIVLWIWATNMVAKPGFNRLELNHLSLLHGDTTCHKSNQSAFSHHGWIYSQSMKHIFLMEHQTWRMYYIYSFSIHWSLFIMLFLVIWRDAHLDPCLRKAYPFLVQSLAEQFG